jgi:predicted Zn-dependent peptidase
MYKKVLLSNNIPVAMLPTTDVRSVCTGIWVKVGSRHEDRAHNGISHFLEHMLFKGTESRTAKSIAVEIDSMGGELNAFTSCENTTFYIKTLDEHLGKSIDLLTDIFMNSVFRESDIEKEKNIITEEIKMVEDTPSDYVHELFSSEIWGGSGLGQPVLGKRETIGKFTRSDLWHHIDTFYGSDNIVVACSGNFREDDLIALLNRSLGAFDRRGNARPVQTPDFVSTSQIVPGQVSESHICLGLEGIPYDSDDRYAMYLLNTVLGAGFSSRLFQEVREKRGLVYSIYSYTMSYSDTALWAVYAGTDRKNVKEVIDVSVNEIRNIPSSLTEEELQRAKDQLKGNIILALESTNSRMASLAKQEIYFGRYYSPEDVIRAVDSVTLAEVKNLSHKIAGKNPFALTLYGPVNEADIDDIRRAIE